MPWPSVIFFDAGGTLLAPHPSVGHIYAEVAGRFGVIVDPEEAGRAFALGFDRVRERTLALRPHLFGFSPTETWKLWREVLGETFSHLGGQPAAFEAIFNTLYEEFASARRYRLLGGALDTLDALRERGHRTGLISNWDHRLHHILEGLGLAERLDPIVISCDVKAEKPNPRIFELALEAADTAPADALMVGDSVLPDISGARGVGMAAVLLDPDGLHSDDIPRISRLSELPKWIEECGR